MATLALSVTGQVVGGAFGGPVGAVVGRALGALAGGVVDRAIFGTDQAVHSDVSFRLQGSSEGGAIPRIYGWRRLAGNIIWATELERVTKTSRGAKGTSNQTEDTITANFAIALCEGEVAHFGRLWADGDLLDTDGLNIRFYHGTQTQEPDELILAKQGEENAPAYRGTAYLVFEALPLSDFGNRIPNITAEVCRPVGDLEPAIKAITLIPGATEFGYDPTPRVRIASPGVAEPENAHILSSLSDWTLSLDELTALCPNLEHVALVVTWFGTDLRCADCAIEPRVESQNRTIKDTRWQVGDLTRSAAHTVSSIDGASAYGGTPSDATVFAAIADLKARGLKVTLYPFLMMDIPPDNGLDDPLTGAASQTAFPWRGRITCDPAPGRSGSPDLSSAAADQIAAFVGTAKPADFGGTGTVISYSGPNEWSYRRMVLHYARLAERAGGIDAFLVGSELRGLTRVRSGAESFPFVDALAALASDVRAVLGSDCKLTYGADWSEYSGYQPPEAPGDKLFHLDALWAHPDIDAVGIDNYMPVSDWRDGTAHLDAGAGSIYETGYLQSNIAGGEDFDWYYASDQDRFDQIRTPITDGAYGEPWIFRQKDLVSWWSMPHHNRVGGVRNAAATSWVPGAKPIWFTELGAAAVDKAGNGPNAFPDPKSAENALPPFSNGAPDPLIQRQVLRAHFGHWRSDGTGFDPSGNPEASLYDGRMVDPDRIYLWTWDARAFPAFPTLEDVWADGPNYQTGHWLTGRLGGAGATELVAAMGADFGVAFKKIAPAGTLVGGAELAGVVTLRDGLETLLDGLGLSVRNGPDGLECIRIAETVQTELAAQSLIQSDNTRLTQKWTDAAERPDQLALSFADRSRDYQLATMTAASGEGAIKITSSPGLTLSFAAARHLAESLLDAARKAEDAVDFALPPSFAALQTGDVIGLDELAGRPLVVSEIRDGTTRRVTATIRRPQTARALLADGRALGRASAAATAVPVFVTAHLPADEETGGASRLAMAAFSQPWPGTIEFENAATGAGLSSLSRPAGMGALLSPLATGPSAVWDRVNRPELVLYDGHLVSETDQVVINGANRLLVGGDDLGWELIGFAKAELAGTATYKLSGLLRGLNGTMVRNWSAGTRVLSVDGAVQTVPVANAWLDAPPTLIATVGPRDLSGTKLVPGIDADLARPLAPVHLSMRRDGASGDIAMSWVRRSRQGDNSWALVEVPLVFAPEAYRLTIAKSNGTVIATHTLSTAAFTYDAAAQTEDFGTLPASFTVSVAQLSLTHGAGPAATADFGA